jgi:NADPH-dependent glutamate synthase beta subunit-like oxidoreductase
VIGCGPAGMHAALLLAREGCSIEMFEKEPLPGGMLQYYLPKFRFKRDGIRQKVEQLEKLGVKMRLNMRIGKELPIQKIIGTFDAVVFAPGAWSARKLGIENEQLEGVSYWTVFLRDYNEGRINSLKGKRAVVIGAGDTAIDCARTAARLGAKVSIIYRRGRGKMPAMKPEVQAAEKDGVEFLFHLAPLKFMGEKRLEKVAFEKTEERGKELRKTGKTVEMGADIAVIAVGQEPDLSILEGSPFKSLGELPEKVFLVGDVVNKTKLIATAVSSAAEAVEKIKKIL